MRNIFVLPDGSEQQFQYPENRDINVGEVLSFFYSDGSKYHLRVKEIKFIGRNVYYYMEHV